MKHSNNLNPVIVSVVLCNYNYGQFIRQAIESVLCQTHTNLELIIVDDGSTDDSKKIIDEFNDERIVKIFQNNGGQAAAFNAGYENCTGDYIAFLDSDDYWYQDKIKKCLDAFDCKDICIVQHNLSVVDIESNIVGHSHPCIMSGKRDVLREYFVENHTGFFSVTSGIVCRRECLDKIFPLNTQWKICADVAFTRPLPIFGKVFTLPYDLGAYRIHGNNGWMNTTEQQKLLDNHQKYVDYTNSWLSLYGIDKKIIFKNSPIYKKCRNNFSENFISFLISKLRPKC